MSIKALRFHAILLLAFAALAVGCQQPVMLTQTQFFDAFRSNRISTVQIIDDPKSPFLQNLRGRMRYPEGEAEVPFIAKVRLTEKLEEELLASGRVEMKTRR